MFKKLIFLSCILALTGCNIKKTLTNTSGGLIMDKSTQIYPKPLNSWVGDPMPFYDNGKFNIFFLEDLRNGDVGFHPFSLIETNNLYQYNYKGVVIPYENNSNSQELALGTGSIIKDKKGTYHAFYTGHNGNLSPKEVIMHAVSSDMKSWNKVPSDTFFASPQYTKDDFRDPFVFFNESEQMYWMLITTRKDSTGVIAKYTSYDLKSWTDNGVFFKNDMGTDSNLECPSLVKFNNVYYLAFSDQWPNRVVHYRIYDPNTKKFTKPSSDSFDGNGFYAGRLETDGDNLFLFGWIPTKENHDDLKEYNWAGNLAVHQLSQSYNNELSVIFPTAITSKFSSDKYYILESSSGVTINNDSYVFSNKNQQKEYIKIKKKESTFFGEGSIVPKTKNSIFGFSFGINNNSDSSLNIVFNGKTNKVAFYNTNLANIDFLEPVSCINLEIKENQAINYKIIIENGIIVLYINDSKALSTRMYSSYNKDWEIFSLNSEVILKNIKN